MLDFTEMWYACSIAIVGYPPRDFPTTGIDLGAGMRVEKIPDWVTSDEALQHHSRNDRTNIKKAGLVFCKRYEAEALGSPDPEWHGTNPRPIQDSVDEHFSLASVALWLVAPTWLTCGPVFHFGREGDSQSLRRSGSLRPMRVSSAESKHFPTSNEFAGAKSAFESILKIQRRGSCWIALRMLIRALTEEMWEARYLWHWVVLEALFGPENPGETTYRLTHRIAVFLRSEGGERSNLFREAKDAYRWRSKIVHGRSLNKLTPAISAEMTGITETLVRESFLQILSTPKLLETMNSKARDSYLDGIALNPPNGALVE